MPDYTTSIDIDAPRDVVFDHLVDARLMVTWMGEHAQLQARPGGEFAVDVQGYLVRGEYLEVERPHRVVVTWGMEGAPRLPPGASRVTFTLTEVGGGTRLHLEHANLPEPHAARHAAGWANYLDRLRQAAAGEDPGPDTFEPASPARRAIDSYYASWRTGIDGFDGSRLEALLATDLDFEGPIAGHRVGAAGFIGGLRRFVEGLQEPIAMLEEVAGNSSGAALYDAVLPGGSMRFAEFFRVDGDRIASLKLVYDAARYVELGGR